MIDRKQNRNIACGLNRGNSKKYIAAGILIAVILIGLFSVFGSNLITGLVTYEPADSGKLWNNTFDTAGKEEGLWQVYSDAIVNWFYQAGIDDRNFTLGIPITNKLWNGTFNTAGKEEGLWQVYLDAAAEWFYPVSIDDRNFTLAVNITKPSKVTLYWPGNNTNITERYVNFTWHNATGNSTLTYQILVDDSSDFSSPVINVSNILERGPAFSNYTSAELEFKTYYWKVRAYDGFNYGEFSDTWNFTVIPYKAISLIIANVNFGEIEWNSSDATDDNDPLPIIVENVGNVPVNLTFNSSRLWTSIAAPNDYYLFKSDVNESNSFNESVSVSVWTQVPLISATPHIFDLNYIDTNDTVEIELNVTVPQNESAGAKSSDILVSS